MNNRGEFKIQSMLIAILLAFGLFFTLISSTFTSLGGSYDTSEVNESSFADYDHLTSLSGRITEQSNTIDSSVSVDSNAFDYLANIFKSVLAPFKFIYKSYDTLFTVTNQAVTDLNLFPAFAPWAKAVLITLVVIGVVMFSVYLKVRK